MARALASMSGPTSCTQAASVSANENLDIVKVARAAHRQIAGDRKRARRFDAAKDELCSPTSTLMRSRSFHRIVFRRYPVLPGVHVT
jgi:hypothetical protein